MADPRDELADIVVPVAPTASAGADASVWIAGGVVAVVTIVAIVAVLAALRWRRRRFVRRLSGLCDAVARRGDQPEKLASLIDAWARERFGVRRLDPNQPGAAINAREWNEWTAALAELRFAPASDAAWEVLAQLCARARSWPPHD